MRIVNVTTWLTMGFLAVAVAGCARPDWIEQTLVTVDVTGVWRGSLGPSDLVLTLQQSGPKVTGQIILVQFPTRIVDPIEGTISGDTLRFRDSRGRVIGEAQVNGDEMTGLGTSSYGSRPWPIRLRREQ